MSASETRYRFDHSGVFAGTSLLACTSAYDLAVGYSEFAEASGLDDDQLFSDPVVATPLPLYRESAAPRRWSHLALEALWHPLFWLPDQLAHRRQLYGTAEPDEEWAVRVCLELEAAGLYQPDRGWLDVLAAHGIRTEDSADVARVRVWLTGQPDPVLDTVDLANFLVAGDDDWALDTAAGITGQLQGRAWALIADELIGFIAEAEAGADAVSRAQTVVDLAYPMLGDSDVPDVDAHAFWTRVEADVDRCHGDQRQLLDGPLQTAQQWLAEVRTHYWPDVEALATMAAAVQAPAAASSGA